MPTIKVLNQEGTEIKELVLAEEVFGVQPNMQVVYDVVNAERAAMRQGTHCTKGRSEVSGGGKKPWRQKGTGRARQGTTRAPQWRGGGIVFGPKPRSYAVKTNKKVVRLAKKVLLSNRLANNSLVVVDQIQLETFKTKELVKVLDALKVNGKVIVMLAEENTNLSIASNNIPNCYVQNVSHLSVYDLIVGTTYVLTEGAVKKYEEELK